jgi:uncharacterized lipoprotein YbaY
VRDAASDEVLVEGRVVIPSSAPALDRAAVHVRLEEVSAADAPSTLVTEAVIGDVRHRAGGNDTVVPFALRGRHRIDLGADYAVRVWVDHDGDGVESPGDLYSDERHPVLTRGFGRAVDVVLRDTGGGPVIRRERP